MFEFFRQAFADIAAERIARVGDEKKQQVLDDVDAALKRWRYEQADADGMVELPASIAGGLLSQPITLAKLAKGDKPPSRRVPVESVEPHELIGGYVACPSDLLMKLWSDKYPPAIDLDKVGIDVVVAALIERDAATMPIDSLAYGIRVLWMFTWQRAKNYGRDARETYALLVKIEEMQGQRDLQLAGARDASKAARAQAKKRQDDGIHRYVMDEVRRRPGVDTATLTNELWSDKKRHGITLITTKNGLKRKVATERTRALKLRK